MKTKPVSLIRFSFLLLAAAGWWGGTVRAGSSVVAWGANTSGQTNVPAGLTNAFTIAGGSAHSLALKADGTLVAWGSGGFGQTNIPPGLTNVVAITAGHSHNVVLKADGTLVAWGLNNTGQTNVPPGLSNVVAIAAGNGHNLALKRDGTVLSWGHNPYSQTNVPPGLTGVVAIAAGLNHCLALKAGGTVVAWGNNSSGQTNVPAGLANVMAIAGGSVHSMALIGDGSVVAWGGNSSGQTNVPAGLTATVAIAAGSSHSLALRQNGTVVAWGANTLGQTNVPPDLTNTVAIGAGHFHSLVVVGDGLPEISLQPTGRVSFSGDTISLTVRAHGPQPVGFQWRKNGAIIADATNAALSFASVQLGDAGNYSVLVSNAAGSVLSAEAVLSVVESLPLILTPPANAAVQAGALAQFQVVADGSRPLSYQWQFEGTNVAAATNTSLLLANVSFADAGAYAAVVNNAFGAVTSAAAMLFVGVPPLPGSPDPAFDPGMGADGIVRSMTKQTDGKVIIGGWFNNVGGLPRPGLARLNSDGSLDASFPSGSGPNSGVLAVALQDDGQIMIAGDFTSVNGVARQRVARLNPDGSLAVGFDPGVGPDQAVWAVAAQADGRVWIGGDFYNVGGAPRRSIARLNVNGSLDTNSASVTEPNGVVRALALQADGRVLIGGGFTSVNGVLRGRFARMETNGTVDATFGLSGANDFVNAITVQNDGRILIGGFFTSVADTPRNRIARLQSNGSLDNGFDPGPGPDNGVNAIAVQGDGKVVVGGGFTSINGRPRGRLARLYPEGRLDGVFEFAPGTDNWIEAVTLQGDGHILIGGAFTQVGGVSRSRVARVIGGDPPPFAPIIDTSPTNQTVAEGVNLTLTASVRGFPEPGYQWQFNGVNLSGTAEDIFKLRNVRLTNAGIYAIVASNSLGSVTGTVAVLTVLPAPTQPGSPVIDFHAGTGPNRVVNSIAVQGDGKILIGGGFTTVDGVSRLGVARLAADGSLDGSFVSTLVQQGFVQSVVAQGDGRILVGGYPQPSLARLLASGLVDPAFTNSIALTEYVEAVAVQTDGKLLVGGSVFIGSSPVIRRLESNGLPDTNFVVQPDTAGSAYAVMVQPDARILVGGSFTTINGVARGGIARLNPDGSIDPSFNPGSGANGCVNAIVRQNDGRIVIAGQFSRFNGVSRNRVARLHPNGTLDLSFNPGPGPDAQIFAVALTGDGRILIGGGFTGVNGIARGHIARLNSDGTLDFGFDPGTGTDGTVEAIVVDADGSALIGGSFFTVNGVPRPGIARVRGGGPVSLAPAIVVPPTNQVVAAGEDVLLTVLATGVPAPTYQWQFNGENIPGADAWVLPLRNVRSTNGGVYRVRITNPHGTVTSGDAVLSVALPQRNAGTPDIDFYSGAGPNDRVNAIVLQPDGRIVIGGKFTEFNGAPRGRLARLARNGALDATFAAGPGADGSVNALAVLPDGKLIVGGTFTNILGVPRNRIARLNSDGSLDLAFDPGLGADGAVLAVAATADGQVLIGGEFSFVGGIPHPGVARFETGGAVDPTFVPPWIGGSSVMAMILQGDGQLLLGGFMRLANGAFYGLARLTAQGSLDPAFTNPFGPNNAVLALTAQEDGRVLLGGHFGMVGGTPRSRIARLNTNGTLDAGFNPGSGAGNVVRAVALQRDGRVLIGGDFTGVNGHLLNRIARLATNGQVDVTFDPGSGVTDGATSIDVYCELIDLTGVYAIAVEADGRVLIGGDFTKVNGVTRPGVARLYDHEPLATIQIRQLSGAAVELYWEIGILEQAADLAGPWTDVEGATSAYPVSLQGSLRFFRLRLN